MTSRGHEFTAEETAELLAELDERLRARGLAAAVFVVGGAALAANHGDRERLTEDVDALTRDQVVMEEARALARERGLPASWLNSNASMWRTQRGSCGAAPQAATLNRAARHDPRTSVAPVSPSNSARTAFSKDTSRLALRHDHAQRRLIMLGGRVVVGPRGRDGRGSPRGLRERIDATTSTHNRCIR